VVLNSPGGTEQLVMWEPTNDTNDIRPTFDGARDSAAALADRMSPGGYTSGSVVAAFPSDRETSNRTIYYAIRVHSDSIHFCLRPT
jgi:hypothetical protein